MTEYQKLVFLAKIISNKPYRLLNDLTSFYSPYVNGDKIVKLLVIWLSQYYFFYLTYNKKKKFKNFISLRQCFIVVSNNFSNKKVNLIGAKKNLFLNFLSKCFINISDNLVMRGYAHDKNKKLSRYISYLSRIILRYIPNTIDKTRKINLLKILMIYLDHKKFKYLNIGLPDIFFSKEIKLLSKKRKIIKSSPHVFWDLDGYEKILLVQNKLYIHGFQHGGGNILKNNLDIFSEKIMSDIYWEWGFGSNNIRQHRYKKIKENSKYVNRPGRILWIERSNLPDMSKFLVKDYYQELKDKKVINIIESELEFFKDKAFRVPHYSKLSNMYKFSKVKIIKDKVRAESIIKKNDIVVFDNIGHSLIYFCLFNSLPFVCIMDINKYSKNYDKKYFNFLKSKKHIIDCKKVEFRNKLNELILNKK